MGAISIFEFEGNAVRSVVDESGDPWWVGKDVCRCLEIVNSNHAISRLDDDEKRDGVAISDPIGRQQKVVVINEPGLYTLIMRGRTDAAKRFRRWVTHDMLPALRRDGFYALPGAEPDDWDMDDVPDYLPPRDISAWVHAVNAAGRWFGPSAARAAWDRSPLPSIYRAGDAPKPKRSAKAGEAALRHLLSARPGRWPEMTVADCIGLGRAQPDVTAELARMGMIVSPPDHPEMLVVAAEHPGLLHLFRVLTYCDNYAADLRAVAGAGIPAESFSFAGRTYRAVLVPLDAVQRIAGTFEGQE